MIASTLLTAVLAVGAVAKPSVMKKRDETCLSHADAVVVAETWAALIANYSSAVADASLTIGFTDYSESVNSLINRCPQGAAAISLPLLNPTFTNRTQFEIGQSQQPPLTFDIQQVWAGCGSVSFRWMTNDTAPIPNPNPVVGNIIIETQVNPDTTSQYKYLINTVYSEFDAAEWLANLKAAGICPADACTSTSASSTATATGGSTATITPTPTITGGPTYATSTSTDADGNVWVVVTEVDDVYVTATDVVTVTLS